MTTQTFRVGGMSCAHCLAAVTKALKGVPGVASAEVDLTKAEARVGYDESRVTVERLAKAVEDSGYSLANA